MGKIPEAVVAGDVGQVEALLRAGENPNSRDAEGTVSLILAAREAQYAAGMLLIEFGADFLAKDSAGRTAVEIVRTTPPFSDAEKESARTEFINRLIDKEAMLEMISRGR